MIPTDWTPVNSSNLLAIKFEDPDLLVRFADFREYRYHDVPETVVETLYHSPSPGQYFRQAIRNNYSTEQVA